MVWAQLFAFLRIIKLRLPGLRFLGSLSEKLMQYYVIKALKTQGITLFVILGLQNRRIIR